MSTDSLNFAESLSPAISRLVLEELPLAVYDPNQPRRVRVPVASFTIELLEKDEIDGRHLACAAGPIVLDTPEGPRENHLRLYIPLAQDGSSWRIGDPQDIRAAYVVVTDEEVGACKETAALANTDQDTVG